MASSWNSSMVPSKQVNIYIRRHPFVVSSTTRFTTSQRRKFLRDVYDYARSLGMSKKDSKVQVIKAREMCGEDEYDTDQTALEHEIDDSQDLLLKLQRPSSDTTATNQSQQRHINGGNGAGSSTIPGQVFPQKRQRTDAGLQFDVPFYTTSLEVTARSSDDTKASSQQSSSSAPHRTNVSSRSGRPQNPRSMRETSSATYDSAAADDDDVLAASGTTRRGPGRPKNQANTRNEKSRMKTSTSHSIISIDDDVSETKQIPATEPVTKKKVTESFAPPEVAMFSDDEDNVPSAKKVVSSNNASSKKSPS